MGFFDRFKRRKDTPTGPAPSAKTRADLTEFLRSRTGVEGFIEPPTPVYSMTLLLVADDGEHVRRPIKDAKEARQLCEEHGAPLYDARIVGYPKRMKDYQRGTPQPRISIDDLPPLEVDDTRDD